MAQTRKIDPKCQGGRGLRSFVGVVLTVGVLAALLAVSPSLPVGAQTPPPVEPVLVSTLSQPLHSEGRVSGLDWAQGFTTGGNSEGYLLSSVDVLSNGMADAAAASKLVVSVNAAAGNVPGAVLATLAWPDFTPFRALDPDQTLRFAAPGGGVRLAADTTYFVVFDGTGISSSWVDNIHNNVRATSSDAEDSGGAAGWSIADKTLSRYHHEVGWDTALHDPAITLQIGVNGWTLPQLVSAPSVVFVREGETVPVRLDLAREISGPVSVTVSSSDPSRVLVNHPDHLFMGSRHLGYRDGASLGVEGVQVQTGYVDIGRRIHDNLGSALQKNWGHPVRRAPSGSISFDFTARDWEGWTSYDEPSPHKGYRVVEVTGVASGADGLPANGPDAKFELRFTSSDASALFPSVTVVVKRSLGLDPVFDPDPKSGFGCRERECLRVVEGGTVSYTVRNFNVPVPGSPLTITPTGEGLSFDPAVVSWTHEDHDEVRTVTVTAAHDDDVRSDTRIVRHVFSDNWDTSGSLSKILPRSKAEAESMFDLAVRVVDDDLAAFDAVGADGAVIGRVDVLSRAGESGSGLGRFWVRVDGPPDCATRYRRTAGLCWDVLRIRLRTGRPDGTWDNAPVAATVHRADQAGSSPSSYTKVAGPRHWYALHVKPEHWDRLLRVDLTLDPTMHGSAGTYDISMSLERDNGEPSAHRTLRVSYGPNLETFPSVDDNSVPVPDGVPMLDGVPVPDDQQAPRKVRAEQQQADPDAAPYAADPQVVAAVQYLASQTHHGFAHVNRWQRALAALGVLDPADVTGGALTLTEARQNTQKYSSPVWHQIVAEIQAKQTHDTQQQQQPQQDQPQQPQQDQPQQDQPQQDQPQQDQQQQDQQQQQQDQPQQDQPQQDQPQQDQPQQDQPQQDQPQQQPQQDQPQQDQQLEPVPYAADPQVVAAVQYLASQTHHGFAHVNRWQRALAAIGALDPADVSGGALSLAEARANTNKYSSPVWHQVVAEIQAKQAFDTTQ